jgi:site-specific DNA-methyltransferase (adenine-specific)
MNLAAVQHRLPIPTKPELSQYWTPEWAAALLVERHFSDLTTSDRVLEPTCGRGAWLKAVPANVPAIGIEIDEAVARRAAEDTDRQVLIGDFRRVELPWDPTLVVGNPPFVADLVDELLEHARRWLPSNGRCGLLLPAYAFQTPRRVTRWGRDWSIATELVPRTLFMRSRLPLVFALFTKGEVRTMTGLALYRECSDLERVSADARLVLVHGRSRQSVWRALVAATLQELGGEASLPDLYAAIEPRRPTPNGFWREKVRQVVQQDCIPVARGVWRLAAC